jgi:hypothetical protein
MCRLPNTWVDFIWKRLRYLLIKSQPAIIYHVCSAEKNCKNFIGRGKNFAPGELFSTLARVLNKIVDVLHGL